MLVKNNFAFIVFECGKFNLYDLSINKLIYKSSIKFKSNK